MVPTTWKVEIENYGANRKEMTNLARNTQLLGGCTEGCNPSMLDSEA